MAKKASRRAGAKKTAAADQSFTTYTEYNRLLRAWFVAFGIGGPALFLINKDLAIRLAEIHATTFVAAWFLVGVAAQVLTALINKVANWSYYYAADHRSFAESGFAQAMEWLVRQFWLDVLFDVVTIFAFGVAVWKLFTIFAA